MAHRDSLMLEVAAVGELLVARIRLVAVLLIFMMPLLAWWSGADRVEVVNGAVFASVALVFALALHAMARRHGISTSLRYASAGFDVTSVSLVLALFLLQGYPHTAVNSRVVWELYLISIAATALRADPKVCMFAGGLAMVQYAAIILGAVSFGDLSDPRFAPFAYGFFSWGDQVSRLILLAMATLLALAAVMQTCRLLLISSLDRTTGICNRAYLDSRLDRELRESRLKQRPLSLAMVDIDHFKRFNDRYGHLAGDTALGTVSQAMREIVEPHGFVARYGGEEFTLVFPGMPLGQAQRLCEAVRRAVENICLDLAEDSQGGARLTVSLGLAELAPDHTVEALIDVADRRLSRAKQAGRNRLVAAPAGR